MRREQELTNLKYLLFMGSRSPPTSRWQESCILTKLLLRLAVNCLAMAKLDGVGATGWQYATPEVCEELKSREPVFFHAFEHLMVPEAESDEVYDLACQLHTEGRPFSPPRAARDAVEKPRGARRGCA